MEDISALEEFVESQISLSSFKENKKPKRLEISQLLRKTWHVNQIF